MRLSVRFRGHGRSRRKVWKRGPLLGGKTYKHVVRRNSHFCPLLRCLRRRILFPTATFLPLPASLHLWNASPRVQAHHQSPAGGDKVDLVSLSFMALPVGPLCLAHTASASRPTFPPPSQKKALDLRLPNFFFGKEGGRNVGVSFH